MLLYTVESEPQGKRDWKKSHINLMEDLYHRYGATADGGTVSRTSFPGYFSSEALPSASHHALGSYDLQGASSDFLQRDIQTVQPGAYGLNDVSGIGARPEALMSGLTGVANANGYPSSLGDSNLVSQRQNLAPGISASISDALNERPGTYGSNVSGIGVHPQPVISGVTRIASAKGYPLPLGDPHLLSQRRNSTPGISADIPDAVSDRPSSLKNADDLSVKESNILFVGGLPTDCTRREVGHLFRPFIGYKDIKVIHKEPRRSEDRAKVLCFVEFSDSKYALTAMDALQGYKVDDKKPDSPSLKIQYAHFPFRLPSDHDEHQIRFP